jgi:ABC-2 type transport system permease protein
MRFIGALQYRAAAFGGIATQLAWGGMEILALAAFYRANPSAFPMEFSHAVSYVWMQQAFLTLFVVWSWEADILSSISEGSIAYDLVRPVDLYGRWLCQIIGSRLAKALLRCSPILIAAFILPEPYGMSLPPGAGTLLLFFLSAFLSLGVVAAFSMLIYISNFYTLSAAGIRLMVASLADFLSGAIVPLPFFPDKIRAAAELLPFASMQNMPLRIYSGNIVGPDIFKGIALQILWLLILFFAGRAAMGRALGKVVVQGG